MTLAVTSSDGNQGRRFTLIRKKVKGKMSELLRARWQEIVKKIVTGVRERSVED